MSATKQRNDKWPQTIEVPLDGQRKVKCHVLEGGILAWVLLIDPDGNSLEMPPDMVDLKSLSEKIGLELKLE